jgi:hypothetical protein
MNAFYFYPTVAGTCLAALTLQITPSTARRAANQAAISEMETTWIAAENDSDRYRTKSMEEIEAYTLILRGMASRCERGELASRDYLRTRLQSLREHIDYARAEALKLPSSGGDGEFTPAYSHFHRTLMTLKGAFSQTADELANGA